MQKLFLSKAIWVNILSLKAGTTGIRKAMRRRHTMLNTKTGAKDLFHQKEFYGAASLPMRRQKSIRSKTFLKAKSFVLARGTVLYIPGQFAHGFSVLSEKALVQYGVTSAYNKSAECGINYDDPTLNINWKVSNPIVSDKDKILPMLMDLPKDCLFE